MIVYRIIDHPHYLEHAHKIRGEYVSNIEFCNSLANDRAGFFRGYSYQANDIVNFKIINTGGKVNWRETLTCPITKLNNRLRYTLHVFDMLLMPYQESNIYITEQSTPLHNYMKNNYANVIGSEYLGDKVGFGKKNNKGILNQDLTALTFEDETFDILMSFDVLEHIPDYRRALSESLRVLAKGGKLLFSVPFVVNNKENIVRAIKTNSGEIEHLLEPEYHGDPVNKSGILCFYHFGWELLNEIRNIGFSKSYAVLASSKKFGYLGQQILFIAEK